LQRRCQFYIGPENFFMSLNLLTKRRCDGRGQRGTAVIVAARHCSPW
jgi:hypothetical protein